MTSKLVKTAKRCKEILETEDFELDMETFYNIPDSPFWFGELPNEIAEELIKEVPCGTTFCLAGYMAHKDKYPSKFRSEEEFDFIPYSENLIGYSSNTNEWSFMFSEEWPSNKTIAIRKMDFVIEHGRIPTEEELYEHFNLSYGEI